MTAAAQAGEAASTGAGPALRSYPASPLPNPYPGLRPFELDEEQLYRGREDVLENVEVRVSVSPLTVLIARSGLGKSSFLVCRLMPFLKRNGNAEYVHEWGGAPEQIVREKALALVEADRRNPSPDRKPVLVLDQFEDVFKSQETREPLWDLLAEYVNGADPELHILVSMREEWLGAWAEAAEYLPTTFLNTIRLGPLTDDELVRAIVEPAALEGVHIDRNFAQAIVDGLKAPNIYDRADVHTAPGLVQLVCKRLWEESANRKHPIDEELYEKILGGAERIKRQFVWTKLKGTADEPGFSARERVLLTAISRYLTAGEDIKSQVSARAIAEHLRLSDFGMAGAAATAWPFAMTLAERRYLKQPPELRKTAPPPRLLERLREVLDKSAEARLVKRLQVGPGKEQVYELVHDSLGPIFRQFGFELQQTIRVRSVAVVGALGLAMAFALVMTFIWTTTKLPADAAILFPALRGPLEQVDKSSMLSELPEYAAGVLLAAVALSVGGYLLFRVGLSMVRLPVVLLVSSKLPPLSRRASMWRTVGVLFAAALLLVAFGRFAGPMMTEPIHQLARHVVKNADQGPALEPDAGLAVSWPFDSPASPSFGRDANGHQRICRFVTRPKMVTVNSLQALHMDSATACRATPFSPSDSGRSFTITGWIHGTTGSGSLFTLESGTRQFVLLRDVYLSNPSLYWESRETTNLYDAFVEGNLLPPPHQWTSVVAAYDDPVGQLRLYVNGAAVGRDQLRPPVPPLSQWRLTIGSTTRDDSAVTDLRNVRVYRRAFRSADAARLQQLGPPWVVEPRPSARYRSGGGRRRAGRHPPASRAVRRAPAAPPSTSATARRRTP